MINLTPKDISARKGVARQLENDTVLEALENSDQKVPGHIKLDISNNGGHTVSIDADITAADYENAKTYKIDKIEINDDYLRDLASKLFDEGKYESVLPYRYWDKEDLIRENDHFDAMLAEVDAEYYIVGTIYNDF